MTGPTTDIAAADLPAEASYRLLTGLVVPRPIAWVTTLSACGAVNLAPFSHFTFVSPKPPMLAISVGRKGDSYKDTARNILAIALDRGGRPAEAEREYAAAVELDPASPARLNLAFLYLRTKRVDEADQPVPRADGAESVHETPDLKLSEEAFPAGGPATVEADAEADAGEQPDEAGAPEAVADQPEAEAEAEAEAAAMVVEEVEADELSEPAEQTDEPSEPAEQAEEAEPTES